MKSWWNGSFHDVCGVCEIQYVGQLGVDRGTYNIKDGIKVRSSVMSFIIKEGRLPWCLDV